MSLKTYAMGITENNKEILIIALRIFAINIIAQWAFEQSHCFGWSQFNSMTNNVVFFVSFKTVWLLWCPATLTIGCIANK